MFTTRLMKIWQSGGKSAAIAAGTYVVFYLIVALLPTRLNIQQNVGQLMNEHPTLNLKDLIRQVKSDVRGATEEMLKIGKRRCLK